MNRQTLTFTVKDWNSLDSDFRLSLLANYRVMLPAGSYLKDVTPKHPLLREYGRAPLYRDYLIPRLRAVPID